MPACCVPCPAVALMEGMALAKTLSLNEPTKPDYHAVPSAVFSHPEISVVVSQGGLAPPPEWRKRCSRRCSTHTWRGPVTA